MRHLKRVLSVLVVVGAAAAGRPPVLADAQATANQGGAGFGAAIDPAIDALWNAFDERAALGHVEFISQYWRLPGNAGYNASIDRIRSRLIAGGFTTAAAAPGSTAARVLVEEYPGQGRSWDYTVGTVAIVRPGAPDDIVLSRDKERLALCINSFSTEPGGIVAPLVDVAAGRDEDYAGKDLKGAIVIGDQDVAALWRKAVTTGGALGVISTALPRYLDADPPGASVRTPRDDWDILQWSSVPYDETRKGFGFKASPRAATRLRRAIHAGAAVSVRVTVASQFSSGPVRSLVAEIPGRTAPDERIVIAAHVQEPGANDNASGVATGAEMAVAMVKAIADGRLPPPARTVTFLFITEISGSRQWLQSHADAARQVKYMFSMDMTGEDVTKTGGTFLIERSPDPGAVWDRPWDPHTEWGRGSVKAESLKGDLINDAHLAVCERVARKAGWVVRTNPYEGGSDHTVFGTAGIPSVLDWHFTDRYYHTNFDTPDKTSPAEMKNVGVAVASTAWLFASATEAIALDVARVVAAAGQARVTREQTEGATLPAADLAVPAWRKWYGEAVRSVERLVVGSAPPGFADRVRAIAQPFEGGLAARQDAGLKQGAGLFEAHDDVGSPKIAGTTAYDASSQEYSLSAGGVNMWAGRDEFQFAWRRLTGDFILQARVEFLGKGVDPHRKAGWMIRPSLEADAPYVDGVIHGDGLTSLQFRRAKGEITAQTELAVKGADVIQLERKGGTYIFSAAKYGEPFTSAQIADVSLGDDVLVGLALCSHNPEVTERAIVRDVRIIRPAKDTFVPYRDFIGSVLEILDVESGHRQVIHQSAQPFEAPNWTLDGRALIYNRSGRAEGWGGLYRFDLATRESALIDTGIATRNNNDHVLSFDGRMLAISDQSQASGGRSTVYTVSVGGGAPRRITTLSPSYVHSWSPDGKDLIFTGNRSNELDIYRIPADGSGPEVKLTESPGVDDGPEYTPDGKFIYFNSMRSGTMQIWRMKPDGKDPEQITSDEYNNWFPHVSPDGRWIVIISFPKEVTPADHPYYKRVYLRLLPAGGGAARVIAYVYGGQGTINVPSWSPDSRKIAFVSNTDVY